MNLVLTSDWVIGGHTKFYARKAFSDMELTKFRENYISTSHGKKSFTILIDKVSIEDLYFLLTYLKQRFEEVDLIYDKKDIYLNFFGKLEHVHNKK